MALLLRDVFEVEFWRFGGTHDWSFGKGNKLFTVTNSLGFNITKKRKDDYSELYLGRAILSVDLFNDYMSGKSKDREYHLIIKGMAWDTESEKSTKIMVYVPRATIEEMDYLSVPSRIVETHMGMKLYNTKLFGEGGKVRSFYIEMVAIEDEE